MRAIRFSWPAWEEGIGTLNYHWYSNNVALPENGHFSGTTSPTLTINSIAFRDAADYTVVIGNAYGYITSQVATVTVRDPAYRIVWSPTNAISEDALRTNQDGMLVGAATWANAHIVTVSDGPSIYTYNFTVNGSVATANGNGTTTGAWTQNTGNGNFNHVLDNKNYDGGPKTIGITNLIPGHRYSIYLFALEDSVANGGRKAYFQDPNDSTDVSSVITMSNCVYVVGTVTAETNYLTIIERLPGYTNSSGNLVDVGNGNINALVVRDISVNTYFSQQPAPDERYQGYPISSPLSAMAASSLPTTYQWQKGSGGVYTNFGSSGTLTNYVPLYSPSPVGQGDYRLVLNNSSGTYNSQVATITVLPLPAANTYAAALLSYVPLAYWKFDEAAGSAFAYDVVGGLRGTYGATNVNGLPGVPTPPFSGFTTDNLAFACGAARSWVTVTNLSYTVSNLTIIAWVYPTNAWTDDCGLFMARNSFIGGVQFRATGQTLGYHWNGDNQNCWGWDSGAVAPTNRWSLVAVTISPDRGNAYVVNTDGMQAGTNDRPHDTETWQSPTWIGRDSQNTAGRTFPGLIDEVAVFARTLTMADITNLYNARLASLVPEILVPPVSAQIYQGFPHTFSATATILSPPASYRWQKGIGGVFTNVGSSVVVTNSGSFTMSLALSSLKTSDVADYRVVVQNSTGAVTSQVATLTTMQPPAANSYQAAVLSYGPMSYWQFNEPTNVSIAYDYVGGFNGSYGTNRDVQPGVPNPPFPSDGTNLAFRVAATNSWVTVPTISRPASSNLTIVAWVNLYDTPLASAGLVKNRGIGNNCGLQFGPTAGRGQLGYDWNNGAGGDYRATWNWASGVTVPTNQWCMVALTVAPDVGTVYCIDASGNVNYRTNLGPQRAERWGGPVYIGYDPLTGDWITPGTIDDVAVFERTLSIMDITNLFNSMVLAPPGAPTILNLAPGDGQVTVNWTNNLDTDSVIIKRGTHSGSYTSIATNDSITTTFVDTGVTNGTLYYYVVSAVNLAGQSANSAEVSVMPGPPPVSFTIDNPYRTTNQVVTFTDTTTNGGYNTDYARLWNFGDGTTDTNRVATHMYLNPYSGPVSLAVTNIYGLGASVLHNVSVTNSPAVSVVYPSRVSILRVQVQTNDLKLYGTNWPFGANASYYVRWTNNVGLSKATWVTNGSVVGDQRFNGRDGLFTNVILGGATNGSKGFYFIHAP